jgi:hypothetical protein
MNLDDPVHKYLIEKSHQPEKFRAGCLTTTITARGPVVAKEFAGMIVDIVELLEACEPEAKCPKLVYQLVEAAVIGERAVFTVSGLTEKQLAECRRHFAETHPEPPAQEQGDATP